MATTVPAVASDPGIAESDLDEPITEAPDVKDAGPTDRSSAAAEDTDTDVEAGDVEADELEADDTDTDNTDTDNTDNTDTDNTDSQDNDGDGDPPEDDSGGDHGAESPSVRRTIYFVISVVVAAAAIIAAVMLGRSYTANEAAVTRDSDITTAARQVVANLVTLRHGTADADVQRIRDGATGEFLNQIGDTTGGFAAVLQQGQVDSTGEAGEVAILSSNDDTATVIAAVTSEVKNSQAPEGQPRVYRMKLQLAHVGDRWLVSDVEFVS